MKTLDQPPTRFKHPPRPGIGNDAQTERYLARLRYAHARGPCFIADFDPAVRGAPVEPAYPDEARLRGLGGTAIVRVSLTSAGDVVGATIVRSTGSSLLDASAVAAATATRYSGACTAHKAVPGTFRFSANFSP